MWATGEFYLDVAIKLAVAFVLFIVYMNLSGRGQLAPTSPVDQIGNYVLGGIVGGVIYNSAINVVEMVVIMMIWIGLLLVTRLIRGRSARAKTLIDGESLLLYDDGRINTDNLRIANRSVRDFIAGMHMRGIHRLKELQSVWIETNGQYTVLKKGEEPFPIAVIEDGHIRDDRLTDDHDESWLRRELARQGYDDPSRVVFAEWSPAQGRDGQVVSGKLTVYPYA